MCEFASAFVCAARCIVTGITGAAALRSGSGWMEKCGILVTAELRTSLAVR